MPDPIIYPEIHHGRTDAEPFPKATFPKACPVCGACVVELGEDSARYACGGAYTSKSQIQTHTFKWWGSCPGNEETFRKVRTKKDIRNDPRVEELWNEGEDGWWASLVDGYQMEPCSEVHCVHESTIADVCMMLNVMVSRCAPGCPCGHGAKAEEELAK